MREEYLEQMEENEFLEYLWHPDIKKAYLKESKIQTREVKKRFKLKIDHLIKTFKNHIEDDRRHSSILNMCISPFLARGSLVKTGYRFIRASPLLEKGLPNMDFLLLKKNPKCDIAIFGECKGRISSSSSIISELKRRKNAIVENMDYIKSEYLGPSESGRLHPEYVLAVSSEDAGRMLSTLIDAGGSFILWQTASQTALPGDAEVRWLRPPKESTISRENMMHIDPDLRGAFDQDNPAPSYHRMFSYFPQSHIFIKLCSLLMAASRPGSSGGTFKRNDLKYILSKDLFYMNDALVASETDYLISKGLEINFIEDLNSEEEYRIVSQGRIVDLERQLEDKWIASQLEKELEKEIHENQMILRCKFDEVRQKRPTLADYSN